jgi:hypothetical protein
MRILRFLGIFLKLKWEEIKSILLPFIMALIILGIIIGLGFIEGSEIICFYILSIVLILTFIGLFILLLWGFFTWIIDNIKEAWRLSK